MKDIPNDLKEALQMIKDASDPEFIEKTKGIDEDEFGALFHMRQGMRLRNNWGLWYNKTPISKWFIERGIQHADDKSGILMTSFVRWIKGEKIKLDEQIKFYRDYWKDKGHDPDNLVDYNKM